jgi:hypothetical protein
MCINESSEKMQRNTENIAIVNYEGLVKPVFTGVPKENRGK